MKKRLTAFIMAIVLGSTLTLPAVKTFAEEVEAVDDAEEVEVEEMEGQGTKEDPFLISTAEQFQDIKNNPDAYYKLDVDIDMSEIKNFEPIDNFNGVLDGDECIISNLNITAPDKENVAIFKNISEKATINTITFENINISGKSNVAGLAVNNNGLIDDIIINGNITALEENVAGLVNNNSGKINNIITTCKVKGSNYVGGITTKNYRGTIEASTVKGSLTGLNGNKIGAISTKNYQTVSTIKNACWNATKVGVDKAVVEGDGDLTKGTIGIKYDEEIEVERGVQAQQSITFIGDKEDVEVELADIELLVSNKDIIRDTIFNNNNTEIKYTFLPYKAGEANINYRLYIGYGEITTSTKVKIKDTKLDKGIIYIPDENLKKKINKELRQRENADIPKRKLEELTELYLMSSEISDLEGIQYCTNLKELDLQCNNIKDISLLKDLKKLRLLFLNVNKIEDITPLSGLTNLRELALTVNPIKDISPLSNLKKVYDLDLGGLLIKDIKPLEELESLKYLDLYRNRIDNLDVIRNLKKLESIDLSNNELEDLNLLKDLDNLNWVSVSYNNIKDLTPLEGLVNLRGLIIENNKVEDISLLSKFDKLEFLNLSNNKISDISPLANLPKLENVKLENQQITLQNKEVNGRLIIKNPIKSIDGYEEAKDLSNNGQVSKANKYLTWNNIKDNNINNLSFNFNKEFKVKEEKVVFSGTVVQPIQFNKEALKLEDINKDKTIDISDLAELGVHYNKKDIDEDWNEELDLNKDDIIDIFDLVIVSKSM